VFMGWLQYRFVMRIAARFAGLAEVAVTPITQIPLTVY